MYELFVLGQLMEGEKHGYLIQERLKHAVGPIRQISSGTLYPLITRLVKEGWVNLRQEELDGARARKIYALTDAGRERFHQLMTSPLEYTTDAELLFHFKMTCFHYVPKDVQLACLRQYANYLEYNLNYVNSLTEMFRDKPINEEQRGHVLRMLDHRAHVGMADRAWVMAELERVAGQSPVPGTAHYDARQEE